MTRIALSHSRLSDFNQCPRKFHHKYIKKTPNFVEMDDSPHLIRGSNVHKALENYLIKRNAGQNDIPVSTLPEVESTKPFIEKLIGAYSTVLPEAQVSIDDTWKQVDWFSKESYYRAIFDVIALREGAVFVGDYKTGKFREYTPTSGYGQLELSAGMALSLWPEIETVKTTYLYVDHRKTVSKDFNRSDSERLVVWFNKEHDKVNAEVNFDPKQNEFCKWCPATKLQCQYARKL